jgi:hypothetical protein
MTKEQSLLLAIRHQMSVLGYSESEINLQDEEISKFTSNIVKGIDFSRKPEVTEITYPDSYKYYMHINDPEFSTWGHDALMCTFESDSDWEHALDNEDIAACCAIIAEVETFCQTHRVPKAVVNFYRNMPKRLVNPNWFKLRWNTVDGIVDAYCDEDASEHVDGITGEE